jgi:hypothetical protein
MKSITDFFKTDLNAPLHNHVWSWGAVSTDGKRQAWRVWADECKKIDGAWWIAVDYVEIPESQKSPGAIERRNQVDALRAGMPTAGVTVTAVDPTTHKEIKYYDDLALWVLTNEFMTLNGFVWARALRKIPPLQFKHL